MKFCSETESAGPASTLRTIVATNGPATSITPIKTARPGSICSVNMTCRLRTNWCELGMHRPAARVLEFRVSTRHCLQLAEPKPVSYTHLRAHETRHDLVCRLLL